MDRKILKATNGMILTNGNIYGSEIYLAKGSDGLEFREITMDKYLELTKEEENAI